METESEKQQQGQETDQRPMEMARKLGLAPKGGTLFSLTLPYPPFPTGAPTQSLPSPTTPGTVSYSQFKGPTWETRP